MNDKVQDSEMEPSLIYGDFAVLEPGVCDAQDCVPWDKPLCYDHEDLEMIVV